MCSTRRPLARVVWERETGSAYSECMSLRYFIIESNTHASLCSMCEKSFTIRGKRLTGMGDAGNRTEEEAIACDRSNNWISVFTKSHVIH